MSAAPAVAPALPTGGIEELLAPVSAEAPAGESLRYDAVQDRIRELRREDDPTLPQGVWKRELKKADWRGVASEASQALRTRSKDLQLAGWLTEAWIHLDGLAGLARGLDLVDGLCERYWDTLHPLPDEPEEGAGGAGAEAGLDLSYRVAPLGWLATAIPDALLRLPLSRPRGEGSEVCTWGDWKHALYAENLSATRPDAAAELDGVSREGFLASVGLTEGVFYRRLAADAEAALAALGRLVATLEARCGSAAPGFGASRETIEGIARLARRIASERGEPVPPAGTAEPAEGGSAEGGEAPGGGGEPAADRGEPGAAPSSPCTIASRAEAYRVLEQAAEFLLREEPHSPVPYLVKRAVHWGGLSLSELYEELFSIADPKSVFRLLGIRGGEEG